MSLKDLHGYLITKYNFNFSYAVNVTYVNDPHDFYIRPVLYEIFMSTLEMAGQIIEVHKVRLHQIVIFKTQELRTFARGRVSSVNNEAGELTFDIFAQDYGFLEKSVSSENIYYPENEDIISVPPLALPCQLARCYPIGEVFNDAAINLTKNILKRERGTARIKEIIGHKYIVHMSNTFGDIATFLFMSNCSSFVPIYTIRTRRIIPEYQFKFKQHKVGDILHIRVQSGNHLSDFFVVEPNDYKVFTKERDRLSHIYKNKHNILPQEMKKGKAIFVWIDCKYERAVIKEITIPLSKAYVQLMDWGTILEVDISNMKPAAEADIARPVSTIYCSIGESNVCNNRMGRFVYPGFEFNIVIKQVGHNFNTPNIVDVFRME